MAPEVLDGKHYKKNIDLWAIGIILYQLKFGGHPFNLSSEEMNIEEFKSCIERQSVVFPDPNEYDITYSDNLQDVITQLLNKDPEKRMSLEEIKQHKWFEDVNWKDIV